MKEPSRFKNLRERLKSLSNRYAIEILAALSPETGEIVPMLGWDEIIERIMEKRGFPKPAISDKYERTAQESEYEKERSTLATGGTLYESMEKLVRADFVQAHGEPGKKRRKYRITHDGRLALAAIQLIQGPAPEDTEISNAAKKLLKFKNFVRLLPAQGKFFHEVREVNSNLMLQMPPGSGKTFLAMVLILTHLQKKAKCVYLTPYMSISRQVMDEYKELLTQLDYTMVRYDSQSDAADRQLEEADLIVGVYESVLSALLNKRAWTKDIDLVVVDELTELGRGKDEITARNLGDDRSCRLDLLITLLKEKSQIITLSSRFGETDTVARWLDAKIFKPNVRLMPDEYIVVAEEEGVKVSSADGTHEYYSRYKSRLDAIHDYIQDYETKAVLVVAGSRKDAEFYASQMVKKYPRKIDSTIVERIIGPDEGLPAAERLRGMLMHGVAFHHAGLTTSLRGRLERELKAGRVRCVASTTGITAGASFPFDCVAIMFGRALFNIVDRSRYLQIAGRIGEYYLADHGGQVFLALPKDAPQGITSKELAANLLHQPLEPILPEILDPFHTCALLIRELIETTKIKRNDLVEAIANLVARTLRGTIDNDYNEVVGEQAGVILTWMTDNGLLRVDKGHISLSEEARSVVEAGINLIDYVKIRAKINTEMDEDQLIDLILKFKLVQASRPATDIPSEIELQAARLDPVEEWYQEQVRKRGIVKREVLRGWIDERPITELIEYAIEKGTAGDEKARRWIDLDEGDMLAMVNWAANIAERVAEFLKSTGQRKPAERMAIFSKQLRYGLREDAAASDLMYLLITVRNGDTRRLTRKEIRTLVDRGYISIEAIVKKDIDRSKGRPARVRFAKNSGLEKDFAKEVYKAAMAYVRRPLVDNE